MIALCSLSKKQVKKNRLVIFAVSRGLSPKTLIVHSNKCYVTNEKIKILFKKFSCSDSFSFVLRVSEDALQHIKK